VLSSRDARGQDKSTGESLLSDTLPLNLSAICVWLSTPLKEDYKERKLPLFEQFLVCLFSCEVPCFFLWHSDKKYATVRLAGPSRCRYLPNETVVLRVTSSYLDCRIKDSLSFTLTTKVVS